MQYRLILTLPAFLLAACTAIPRTTERAGTLEQLDVLQLERRYGITLYGEWSKAQLAELEEGLGSQHAHIVKAVNRVTLRNDSGHYTHAAVEKVAAHCHMGSRDICFKTGYTRYDYVYHETGHAYAALLGREFKEEWRKVAGDVYGRSERKDGQWRWKDTGGTEPRDGLVTPYGGIDIDEDIAMWYEASKLALRNSGLSSPLFSIKGRQPAASAIDVRFPQKLGLLRKWRWLTETEHRKLEAYVK
jgi:hypothetical protein